MLVVSDFDQTLADISSLANLRERRACRVIHSHRLLVVTYPQFTEEVNVVGC